MNGKVALAIRPNDLPRLELVTNKPHDEFKNHTNRLLVIGPALVELQCDSSEERQTQHPRHMGRRHRLV